jgi:acetyl-CoA synthetase
VESALVSHPTIAEAAVVGATDPVTGQAIVAFVIVRGHVADDVASGEQLVTDLRKHVAHEIGPIAKPRDVVVVPEVPKTRSGKILRRLLAQLVARETLGDTTSLQNPWAVAQVHAVLHAPSELPDAVTAPDAPSEGTRTA